MSEQPNASIEATPEQVLYANVLNIGMYIGLAILFITFAIYAFGIMAPYIPLDEISQHWNKNVNDNPIVTIHVKNPGSQKIYILGEVVNTGEYPMVKDLTVLQAFALAGGFTEWASKKEIILLRNEDGKEKIYRINYKDIVQGKDYSQNIHLKANDTIIVP